MAEWIIDLFNITDPKLVKDISEQVPYLLNNLGFAAWETIYSTVLATLFAYLIGLPLGVLLVTGFGAGGMGEALWTALGAGGGYVLAMLLCWSIRERLDLCDIPKAFRGAPILFIYLGLLSLALFGLVGHQLAL